MSKLPHVEPPMECITPEPGTPEARAVRDAGGEGAALAVDPIATETIHAEPIGAERIGAEPIVSDARRSAHEAQRRRAEHRSTEGDSTRLSGISTETMYRELLVRMGEDPERDGLLRTPERVERSMRFLTRGYEQTIEEVLHRALFDVSYDEMVIVRDVEFYSLCEHHMLPFFGKAHIAYVPQGKVIGLSKLPRLVDVFARRLQVQERLTRQIAEAINEAVQPQGVAVILEAQHLCMMMRGVEKQQSLTTTSAMLGVFQTQVQTRTEFLALLRRPGVSF